LIRAVIDAGVFIAGTISPHGAPAAIVRAWQAGAIELVVCPELLRELRRAFSYPRVERRVSPEAATKLVNLLEEAGVMFPDPSHIPSVCRDPDDDYLFALAHDANAVLVSGDGDVLAVEEASVRVLSPAALVTVLEHDPEE
jgi:putative PIN family toxin of toxin-antitoxin system